MRRLIALLIPSAGALVIQCGGVNQVGEQADAAASVDAFTPATVDAAGGSSTETGTATTPCIPGRSIACTGPGGCSSNQVCKNDGSGFGPCTCGSSPPPSDASTMACVPGQSIACSGPGGCISSQVCLANGSGYGVCPCSSDGAALSCIPGQSIQCAGPQGCISYQVCNGSGDGYDPCVCPDGGGYVYGDGGVPDGYAPLPPPVGNQGYNAIWAPWPPQEGTGQPQIYLPLFSAPDCAVIPPYGNYYYVQFSPQTAGPTGTFPSCAGFVNPGPNACYLPAYEFGGGIFEGGQGFTYTLSPFDANGIATGQMNTAQGIVPLVVKNCF